VAGLPGHAVRRCGRAAVAWRSVSDIVTRLVADRAGQLKRLAGLRRIGIDEISYRKGQRYLLVVVDHDLGRLVWAGKNRTAATLRRFLTSWVLSAPRR
jgi:transposase